MPLSNEEILALLGAEKKKQDAPTPEKTTTGLSPAMIGKLLEEEEKKSVPRPDLFHKHGFEQTFLFLLNMNYENLFEPWESGWYSNDGFWWKCKGCGRKVKRTGRESHHAWHKKELT